MAAVGTLNISAPLTITSQNNISTVTIKSLGGTTTLLGSGPFKDFVTNTVYAAAPVTLVDGSSVTLSSPSPSPIDYLLITPAANAEIIVQR